MSSTAWERRKAISDRVCGVFDAIRDRDPANWQRHFETARLATLERLEAETETVRNMTFDEFARLQKLPMPKTVEAS
jgi:hypothetical protein